jgi:hypothetical protein
MYRKENKWRLAKWHGSCSLQPRSLLFVKSAWGEVIMENGIKSEYDVHSAVIFFFGWDGHRVSFGAGLQSETPSRARGNQ